MAAANIGKPGSVLAGIYHDHPATTAPDALRAEAGLLVEDWVVVPAVS